MTYREKMLDFEPSGQPAQNRKGIRKVVHEHRIRLQGRSTDVRRRGLPAAQVPPHLAALAALQRLADTRHALIQRNGLEEEESMQGAGLDEEELLQGARLKPVSSDFVDPLQRQPGTDERGGLPHELRAGIEGLSDVSMAGVRVHRNSPAPASVSALAFAQGRDIHLGPGQERHLPHEAWHVVQQAQGRVRPTLQARGVAINDDPGLEAEADRMGSLAQAHKPEVSPVETSQPPQLRAKEPSDVAVQAKDAPHALRTLAAPVIQRHDLTVHNGKAGNKTNWNMTGAEVSQAFIDGPVCVAKAIETLRKSLKKRRKENRIFKNKAGTQEELAKVENHEARIQYEQYQLNDLLKEKNWLDQEDEAAASKEGFVEDDSDFPAWEPKASSNMNKSSVSNNNNSKN